MNTIKGRVKEKVLSNCKCVASMCLLSALLLPWLPREAVAEEDAGKKGDGVKFCVILRPEIKEAASGSVGITRAVPETMARVSGRDKKSFFKGSMGKLGFGAPDCFFIDGRVAADSAVGERTIHGPVYHESEGITGDRDTRGFFPSAGFYSHSSQEGKMGFAFGVGLGNSAQSSWDDKGVGTPEAKVSLMLGFGF